MCILPRWVSEELVSGLPQSQAAVDSSMLLVMHDDYTYFANLLLWRG